MGFFFLNRKNDIHVEFVNSDETLATDQLTDKAMVIFHIKQHGGCGCGK